MIYWIMQLVHIVIMYIVCIVIICRKQLGFSVCVHTFLFNFVCMFDPVIACKSMKKGSVLSKIKQLLFFNSPTLECIDLHAELKEV